VTAAAAVLNSDSEFSAAIALTFRIDLMNMFFMGDLYAGTGVVVDPEHPPKMGDSLEADPADSFGGKPFSEYFTKVFAPYYLKHRPHSTRESLIADNRLDIIADALRNDPGLLWCRPTATDLILDKADLEWLENTLGQKIAVYDHGGHLGNIGDRRQVADIAGMLAGRWRGAASGNCSMRTTVLVAVAAMGLCGCAPEGMIIHRMPAENAGCG